MSRRGLKNLRNPPPVEPLPEGNAAIFSQRQGNRIVGAIYATLVVDILHAYVLQAMDYCTRDTTHNLARLKHKLRRQVHPNFPESLTGYQGSSRNCLDIAHLYRRHQIFHNMRMCTDERFAKKNEAVDLRRAFDKLDSKGDGKIDTDELVRFFTIMGYKAKKVRVNIPDRGRVHTVLGRQLIFRKCTQLYNKYKTRGLSLRSSGRGARGGSVSLMLLTVWCSLPLQKDVEDMIWEVDEDCDQCVSWSEFQSMYHRCRADLTGYEPRRLFNVVEFIMNDKDDSGTVSVEEAMQILYLRYGKQLLDTQLEEIFGTSDTNSGKDLTLSEFLQSLNMSQVRQLRSKVTAKTYKAPAPPQKKKK
eukprot:5625551-Pyramimonas_sp.AAC.1